MKLVALGILAVFGLATPPSDFGSDGHLTSADLLKLGFEDVASGDLMTTREFRLREPSEDGLILAGCPGGYEATPLVARMDTQSVPACGRVTQDDARFDGFVRLKRGVEEFVCIFRRQEKCHRVYDGSI